MDAAAQLCRLVIMAVLLVAAAAKLADQRRTRSMLEAFSIPRALVTPGAVGLALVELGLAVALAVPSAARGAGVGAAALLLAFMAVITVALVQGRHPDCSCFGQLHSGPVGTSTLVRNGILMVLATMAAVGSLRTTPWAWISGLTSAERVALGFGTVIVLITWFGGWLGVQLLRQNGRILERLERLETARDHVGGAPPAAAWAPVEWHHGGLEIGSEAPRFELPSLSGESVTLDALLSHGAPVLLVFSDPQCGPCRALQPEVAEWQQEHAPDLSVVVVTRSAPPDVSAPPSPPLENVLLQVSSEVGAAYRVPGTPSAVLVDPSGRIASHTAAGAEAIRELVRKAGRGSARVLQLDPA